MQSELKIALAQMEVAPGRPDLNIVKMLYEIEQAKGRERDLIVFPEMSVSGYLLGDEWENDSFIEDIISYNRDIIEASNGIGVIWGNVYSPVDKIGEDGRRRKYNSAYFAQNKKWVSNGIFEGFTHKTLMPKYREFDDERYFYSLIKQAQEQGICVEDLIKPFDFIAQGIKRKIGITLCEDMWSDDYAIRPIKELINKGAEIIINISCSPWTWRKNNKRNRVVMDQIKDHHVPFAYCNNVGIQNNGKNMFLFEGNSTFYNGDGTIAKQAEPYEDQTLDVDYGLEENELTNGIYSKEKDMKELYQGLIYGIQKFFEKLPNKKVVIGLSGGIDSAVVAVFLTMALGHENVLAINMPSKFNSDTTKNAAALLAKNLDINYEIIPIQESVDLTIGQLDKLDIKPAISDSVIENIQARDRGSRILAGVSASLRAVFTNNGNKTEVAFGYATLYGDVNGAIAPIADLYKYQVYELAEYINKLNGFDLIPRQIIKVHPSAELSDMQNVDNGMGDPIKYEYHDYLVKAFVEDRKDPEYILQCYLDGTLERELGIQKGLLKELFSSPKEFIEDLEHKYKLFKINIFKRIQSPPIITVSKRAFGFDLRESQNGTHFTRKYIELKEKIMGSGNKK